KKKPLKILVRKKKSIYSGFKYDNTNEYYFRMKATIGRRTCSESSCNEAVYKKDCDLCYFHDKIKKGLIIKSWET
ncbi:MAG: hypothetical protein ACW98W_17595, partial [Candidatus Hodarchaeales archaeon]